MVRSASAPPRERGFTPGGLAERTRRHLANPLFRNAYALMLNTGATGALGVIYWILAARYYNAADVGRSSAAISAMMLLSGFTALNLSGMLTRFLPRAGQATRPFILKTYLASGIAAGTITIGFLLTLDHWGPSYSGLRGLRAGTAFTVIVIAWGIFTLQDYVLPALRSAIWVPLENFLFGIFKIALVVGLATLLPRDGVFLSWVIPVAFSVVPINLLIFLRLAPRHVRATEDRHARPTIREVSRFLAGDYVGALFVLGVVYLVPVAVAARIDPKSYAYFYVAWMIGGVIDLLAVNMATSLTVEGSLDKARLAANTRAALRRTLRILLPIVAATVLLAHPALKVYGASYAEHGATLLQLLALSTLPRALVELHFGALRAESRTVRLAALQGLRCVLVIGLTMALTGPLGIAGAGWAVLVSQSLVAVLILPRLRAVLARRPRDVRLPEGGPVSGSMPPPASPAPSPAATASDGGGGGGIATHPAATRDTTRWWPVAGLTGIIAVGLVLFFWPLRAINIDAMNGYGLVSVLPIASLTGLALLTLGYILTLALNRPRPLFLALQLGVLVVCLHGVTGFVENEPRFPTAWQHLGFLDYIGRTGNVAPTLDARFSWPGFFAVMEFFVRATGLSDPALLLKPAPVVAELLYLVPYLLLLTVIRASWRAKWFAAFLLVTADWVGQDYFSPQSFNYLIYLVVLAVLLTWFGVSRRPLFGGLTDRLLSRVPMPRRLPFMDRWRRARPPAIPLPGELPPRSLPAGQRVALALLVMGLFVVSTASHQISPFMIIVAVAALVAVGRCELSGLPVLFGVIMASWLSFLASGYWTGHLSEIFGGVGSVGSNVQTSVQGRVLGSDPQHTTVLYLRLGLAAAMFGLALLGAVRRRAGGIRDRALLVLAVAPLSALGLQSYGGEVGLRVYLFALPALAILAASLFFGAQASRRSWFGLLAAFTCAVLLVAGFLVAKYGNERFERVSRDEAAALNYVYEHDAHGAQVLWLTPIPKIDATPSLPWGTRDMEKVDYTNAYAPRDPEQISRIVKKLRSMGPNSYLIVNRAQQAYLQLNFSFPNDWLQRLRAHLDASPDLRRVYANREAAVYALATPFAGPPPPPPNLPGMTVPWTPWTPVGVAVVILLLVVLVTREVLRIRLPVSAHAKLVPLTRTGYLLLVGLLAVIIERFLYLA